MKIKLVPLVQVGEFKFGELIDRYLNKYNLLLEDLGSDSTGLDTYMLSTSETSINVDQKSRRIKSIMCHEELYYKGKNLIGLTIQELISFTKARYYGDIDMLDFEEDDIPQYVYEFEDIGLQVWEKGKDGKIVTIIAGPKYSDE